MSDPGDTGPLETLADPQADSDGMLDHRTKAHHSLAGLRGSGLIAEGTVTQAMMERAAEFAALTYELRKLEEVVDDVIELAVAQEAARDAEVNFLKIQSREATRFLSVMRAALMEIRDRDWVQNCLDPQWAARRAAEVLGPSSPLAGQGGSGAKRG